VGQEWVETVLRMQQVEVGPAERHTIHRALQQLASAPRERRTLTELEANLQDEKLKAGLQPYVIDVLWADCSTLAMTGDDFAVRCLRDGDATKRLLRRGDDYGGAALPLPPNGARPRWQSDIGAHRRSLALPQAPGMARQDSGLAEDSAQKNAVVLLATQSMADVKESPIASAILQSTATKIYLPNSEAGNEGMRQFYEYAGLNSREIELLQGATPKRDYYIVQRLGGA